MFDISLLDKYSNKKKQQNITLEQNETIVIYHLKGNNKVNLIIISL